MSQKIQKNLILLGVSLLTFIITIISSTNPYNIISTLFFGSLFIASTNLLFLLVSKKNYIYLYLAAIAFIIYFTTLLLGLTSLLLLVFSILFTTLIVSFIYISFLELEKNQTSSRLFSLSYITKESTHILTTTLILLVSLNIFGGIYNQGGGKFVQEVFKDEVIFTNLVTGSGNLNLSGISLNTLLMSGSENYAGANPDTFYDFLNSNYYGLTGKVILTSSEKSKIEQSKNSNEAILSIKRERAEKLRVEQFGDLPYTLDTVLDEYKFEQVTKKFYENKINNYENTDTESEYLLIPRNTHLPAVIAVIVLLVLLFVRFIITAISSIILYIIWQIILYTEFAKIEIETVEAEVIKI